jgi:Aldehyde dehydrogenase family
MDFPPQLGPLLSWFGEYLHELAIIFAFNKDRKTARVVVGGDPQGQVLPPHVFVNVTNDMAITHDETFGPIAPIEWRANANNSCHLTFLDRLSVDSE